MRFLTHYSSEPVCAMNGIAVYGKATLWLLFGQASVRAGLSGKRVGNVAQDLTEVGMR